MFPSDPYDEILAHCLFLPEKSKNITFTCKCKTQFSTQIPGEIFDGKAIPIICCPMCTQQYVIYNKQFIRMENFKTLNGELIPAYLQGHNAWKRKKED